MTERVDIANLALSWLGEDEIVSLEDDNDKARIMKLNYIPARDATLESHDWTFAIERFVPGLSAETPTWGPGTQFQVPSNILRVIGCWPDRPTSEVLYSPIDGDEQIDWQMEGRFIVTDVDVVFAKGVRRIEEEGLFSPLFVQAFAAKLAMLTSLPLSASKEVMGLMAALYGGMIIEAKSRDGIQGRSKRIRNRSLLQVR